MFFNTVLFVMCLGALLLAAACWSKRTDSPTIEYIAAPGTEDLHLPFAGAVRVDNTLYLSGNLGNIPGKLELVEGGIAAETRQTLENIRSTLEVAGSSMEQIVRCTVFMADMSEWAAMNEVYRTFFKTPPARSAFAAAGLALGARVEIECIAVVG